MTSPKPNPPAHLPADAPEGFAVPESRSSAWARVAYFASIAASLAAIAYAAAR